MHRSTIYTKCPGCGDATLVQEMRGSYVCAACGYDYVEKLANNEAALESWAVDTMRTGPVGQLAVLYLYPRITKTPHPVALRAIKAIAAKHHIDLPNGVPLNPVTIFIVVAAVLVLLAIVIVIATR
jgi:hypothetical protein